MKILSLRSLGIAVAVIGLALALWLWLGAPHRIVDIDPYEGDVARGNYLVHLGGCGGCHTEGKDGAFLAGGATIATPFGTFYGPNITSDPVHGIGAWSGREFADALVNGHSPGAGHLYPVFPFTSYSRMTWSDVADLWTYMKTVEPNARPSRRHDLSNPFVFRFLMDPWKTLFHQPGALEDIADRSGPWNRGRYIVEGPGHCTECHSPRGRLGAIDRRRLLHGGKLPPRGEPPRTEKVPAITPESLAARGYTRADLLMAFRFGLTPDGDVLGGSMGEVLSGQLQHLSAEDLEAVATYLLSPPLD